jgi:hypothetical protein
VDCNPAQTGPGSFCCLDPPPECTDANVQMIQASNYDQSCSTVSDCLAVDEGNACFSDCFLACRNAAINVKDAARYDADVAKTLAGRLAGGTCFCPAESGPCCIGGVCRADIQCSMSGP